VGDLESGALETRAEQVQVVAEEPAVASCSAQSVAEMRR